jgi:hypothetical protein
MKKHVYPFLILFLFFASPFTSSATAMPEDIKNILIQITPTIASQGIGVRQEKHLPEKVFSGNSEMSVLPAAVSAVRLYFPLNNNDVKYYEGSIYGSIYSGSYSYSQVYYNGRTCYLEYDSFDGSKAYYGFSGNTVQMYGAGLGTENYPLQTPLTFLNDSILNNGGTLKSSTTLTVQGYKITLNLTVTATIVGSVSIPLGTVDDCRSLDMTFSYSMSGDSDTLDVRDVWILAPNIGKLRIAVVDEFLNNLGWLNITGGTVGGKSVGEIINPTVAAFEATPLYGLTPLMVWFADRSTGIINNWSWDFGDGTSSSVRNPVHVYSAPGLYSVSLNVSGTGGSDTEAIPEYIKVDNSGADLNNDNKVDLEDAVIALQIVAGLPTASEVSLDNDVNGDNKFGLAEAVYILRCLSGSY